VNEAISGDGSNWFTTHTGNFIVTDHTRSTPSEEKNSESSDRTLDEGAATQKKSSWMSAAYSSAKVVIDVVKESSDVFPPLKSVASGLAAVLKHYDVRSVSMTSPIILTIALASNSQ